jgi:hypothetical protein
VRPLSSALPAPDRVLLGPADVADDELAAFAAAGLGVRHATVLTSSATVFPYDRPRAAIARFALDLLDDTTPSTRPSRARQPSAPVPGTCRKTPWPMP